MSGALYRSSVTGRVLTSTVNVPVVSPTLKTNGKPPNVGDWEHLLRLPPPTVGKFGFSPSVPPSLMPMAKTRGMTVTSALEDERGTNRRPLSGQYPTGMTGPDRPRTPTDAASAGSFNPRGPALSDPDGISIAVTTMRKFRGLIETMPGKPVAVEPKPPEKGLKENTGSISALSSIIRNDRRPSSASSRGLSRGGVIGSGTPLIPNAPPSLAAAIAASASGTSVVGTISVAREHLMRATMIASKWTRIVSTKYGASVSDPCTFVVEMQQSFYTSFLNDMHEATNGCFTFETEAAPTAIKANIGAINMLIQEGATDFGTHLLPAHVSNKKRRFRVVKGAVSQDESDTRAMKALGLTAFKETEHGGSGRRPGSAPSIDGSSTQMVVHPGTSRVLTPASGSRLSTRGRTPKGFPDDRTAADVAEADDAKYSAPMTFKGMTVISKADQHFSEFIEAKKRTVLRAGRKLKEAAAAGDPKALARLIIRGEPVYFDPRPIYERDIHDNEPLIGHTPETNPHMVTTDHVVKPPVDWRERDGETALMVAVRASQPESVRSLLQMGADPLVKNAAGHTATEIGMQRLQEIGEDLRNRVSGAVALRRAAGDIMKILDSRSLLQVVQDGDYMRAKFLLEQMDADVNQTNTYGMTPLHLAVLRHDAQLAVLLIRHGANQKARNNIGQTPLSLIDDIDKKKDRLSLREAFDNGGAEDAARRKQKQDKMKKRTEELQELKEFENKLRTLTRGTTAAKTLSVLTKVLHESATPSEAPRASGPKADPGQSTSSRVMHDMLYPTVATQQSATSTFASPFGPAMSETRPRLGSKTPTHRAAATMVSVSPPKPMGAPPLYDASSKRHMRDFVAISMKEDQIHGAASHGATSSNAGTSSDEAATFRDFYSTSAPPAADRKFDIWFKAHVSPKAKS